MLAKSDKHEDSTIHSEEFTSEQSTSIDPNLQKMYHVFEPTTENNCNP